MPNPTEVGKVVDSYKATAALTTQHVFVELDPSNVGGVILAETAATPILGTVDVTQSTAGGVIPIATGGVVYVKMSATASKGDKITATTDGEGIATTTDKDYYFGILEEDCAAANEICAVREARGMVSAV